MFTRREKIVLGIFGAAFVIVSLGAVIFPNWIEGVFEYLYLAIVVAPAGYLLATDKDRTTPPSNKE